MKKIKLSKSGKVNCPRVNGNDIDATACLNCDDCFEINRFERFIQCKRGKYKDSYLKKTKNNMI